MKYLRSGDIDYQISEFISDYINTFLHINKISRRQLGEDLNISYAEISRMLTGHKIIPLSFIMKFKHQYNINLFELIINDSDINILM